MSDFRQFHASISMSNEVAKDYESDNVFIYHEVKNRYVNVVAFLPLFSGFIDIYILNRLNIYSITWFVVLMIVGAVLCVLDWNMLNKLNYNVDGLLFWALFFAPVYLARRAKIVGEGSFLTWTWLGLFLVTWFFQPV